MSEYEKFGDPCGLQITIEQMYIVFNVTEFRIWLKIAELKFCQHQRDLRGPLTRRPFRLSRATRTEGMLQREERTRR